MRIYLYVTQRSDIDGGYETYRAPGYFNAPKELAEKWIDLGLAVEATLDNTHVDLEPKDDPIPKKRPKGLRQSKPEKNSFSKRPKGQEVALAVKPRAVKKRKPKKVR